MGNSAYDALMTTEPKKPPRIPPRWFVRTAWVVHRAIYAVSRGRVGLRKPNARQFGMLLLTTTGRRTGKQRNVIVAYVERGPDLVLLAMNGWAEPDPAWWLNLQAHPEASVILPDGERNVTARRATDDEQAQLSAEVTVWRLDEFEGMRKRETAVVILEPRP